MAETIIDASNSIVGRLSTVIAKRALLGETIRVVNAEKAVVSGNSKFILNEFRHRVSKGTPSKGPFYPRRADFLLKRIIRGMLPYKQERGKSALKRVKCYINVPEEFKNREMEKINDADASKLLLAKYTSIKEISISMRGKI